MVDIKIIGYYNHTNIGDEQYKITFLELFKDIECSIDFIDIDELLYTYIKDTDIIILGGGDVLSNYFIDKIIHKFRNTANKILAVSVGIPYIDIIYKNKLQIIDYIFIRTKQDIELLELYFDKEKIYYLPDISYFLKNDDSNEKFNTKECRTKTIGLCLSRHIYQNNDKYNDIIEAFSKFITYFSYFGFTFILIPFNTNPKNNNENDILIHNDVYNSLSIDVQSKVTNITDTLTPNNILELFESLYIIIPMKFHACLFASYTSTPFLPVFTTRKVLNFLIDINWKHGYKLDCDSNDLPIKLDINILLNRFSTVVSLYKKLEKKLHNQIYYTSSASIIQGLIKGTIKYHKNNICKKDIILNTFNKVQEYSISQGITDFRELTEPFCKTAVSLVSYYLTGKVESIYNHGLNQKMFNKNYNYIDEWNWILKNEYSIKSNKIIYSNPKGLFNLNIQKDQNDYTGLHRSGWQYVFTNLKKYHNENSDLYLDLYLDKTFHWNNDINRELNIIPYTKKWIGFIHHTFDTDFSQYNTLELFNNPLFIQSLKTCQGLFVLSKYLKEQVKTALIKLNLNIKVCSIIHPTETNVPLFNYTNFIKNPEKKIVNIGGWLRNIYYYYKLSLPEKISLQLPIYFFKTYTYELSKYALKGAHMNNYFPDKKFIDKLKSCLCCKNTKDSLHNTPSISRNPCISTDPDLKKMNNWYKHFYVDLSNTVNSVKIIHNLTDTEYDNLLTENIVFLHLCDASAINTLIECIVRNTPIIINKIPAVVELLGENYPLYYDKEYQVRDLLKDSTIIRKATLYLSKLNKNEYEIGYFISKFNTQLLSL